MYINYISTKLLNLQFSLYNYTFFHNLVKFYLPSIFFLNMHLVKIIFSKILILSTCQRKNFSLDFPLPSRSDLRSFILQDMKKDMGGFLYNYIHLQLYTTFPIYYLPYRLPSIIYYSTVLLPGIQPHSHIHKRGGRIYVNKEIYTKMFIAALSIVTKAKNNSNI